MRISAASVLTLLIGGALSLVAGGCTFSTLEVYEQLPATVIPVTAVKVNIKPTDTCDTSVFDEWEEDFDEHIRIGLRKGRIQLLEPGTENAILAVGAITYMDPGARWLRGLVGFGAGQGVIESQWTIYDREENVVGKASIRSTVNMGFFGGSYVKAMLVVGYELAVMLRGARVGTH